MFGSTSGISNWDHRATWFWVSNAGSYTYRKTDTCELWTVSLILLLYIGDWHICHVSELMVAKLDQDLRTCGSKSTCLSSFSVTVWPFLLLITNSLFLWLTDVTQETGFQFFQISGINHYQWEINHSFPLTWMLSRVLFARCLWMDSILGRRSMWSTTVFSPRDAQWHGRVAHTSMESLSKYLQCLWTSHSISLEF